MLVWGEGHPVFQSTQLGVRGGSRMSDLHKVEERGARWACNSTRRIRDWEVHSRGHTTTYLGVLVVVNWCGEGDLRGWIMTPRYRRKPSVSIGKKQLRLRQAGRRCRRSGWRASVGDASPWCSLSHCSPLLCRTVLCFETAYTQRSNNRQPI